MNKEIKLDFEVFRPCEIATVRQDIKEAFHYLRGLQDALEMTNGNENTSNRLSTHCAKLMSVETLLREVNKRNNKLLEAKEQLESE